MEGQRQRSSLFTALKQVLKAQGIQYKHLAVMMGLSEPTVKRMFQEQDCKLSRLIEICDHIGLSMSELVELDPSAVADISQLPLETETQLAENPGLISFFMLLISHFSVAEIIQHNQLDDSDAYRYLRQLEKLSLIRLGPENQVHFLIARPIRWRLGGPLHKILVEVNKGFIHEVINNHMSTGTPFYSTSRQLSQQSIERLSAEVDALYLSFQKQASLDQLHYARTQLTPFKLVTAMAPFNLRKYFSVPRFSEPSGKA